MHERIAIVGSSGSGKSTLARQLRDRCGYAWLELDALHHGPGWQPRPEGEVRAAIEAFVAREDHWVIDGNYAMYRDIVWRDAETVLWLDLPRWRVIPSLYARSLRRLLTRETLWNGNRERWSNLWSLDPERSVVAWSFTNHERYRAEYRAQMTSPDSANPCWIRLRSRGEAGRFVESLESH